jgi:hypothetical protein
MKKVHPSVGVLQLSAMLNEMTDSQIGDLISLLSFLKVG